MDSLKSLFDKKQYQSILSLTKDSFDDVSLFYRLSSFVGLGNYRAALELIESNRTIYEKNLLPLMKIHFEILFELKDFDKAYEELKHYQDLPYASQEVEEYLSSLPTLIRTTERHAQTTVNLTSEKIIETLSSSKDDYEILMVLDYLKNQKIEEYIPHLIKLIASSIHHPYVTTFALLLLIDNNFDKEVNITKLTKTYHVIPNKLVPPFTGETYNNFTSNLGRLVKDPSLSSCVINLFNEYMLLTFPEDILQGDSGLLLGSFIEIGRRYLKIDEKIMPDILLELSLDEKNVKEQADKIEKIIVSVPVLSI